MSNYKECTVSLGYSDIASLVMVGLQWEGEVTAKVLPLGFDGSYKAYVIDGTQVSIPDHYHYVTSFAKWLRIYDDEGLSFSINADLIKIYRAGEGGILISVYDGIKVRIR